MATTKSPMLFSPPHPPIRLGPDTTRVGRSRSCDLCLPDADASRQHAEIVARNGRFVVYDLGSTNGTFVNGERVDVRELEPGDRIQIGSSTITFCQVESPIESTRDAALSEEKTIYAERPALREIFQGDLAEIPPFAVLQILEMGRKTGLLQIETGWGVGRLWLAGGAPVHAATKSHSGFDAGLAIVNATSGRFTFEPLSDVPEATIEASVTELLLEASRLLDEDES